MGCELWRRLVALRAAVAEDDQRATVVQNKIRELNVKMAHYRMHGAAGMRNNEKRVAGMLLTRASEIESQIADLQAQVAEIRAASAPNREEIRNIRSQFEDHHCATSAKMEALG